MYDNTFHLCDHKVRKIIIEGKRQVKARTIEKKKKKKEYTTDKRKFRNRNRQIVDDSSSRILGGSAGEGDEKEKHKAALEHRLSPKTYGRIIH